VELLLQKGADIHQTDAQGVTALMYACKGGNSECVSILLQAGARIIDRDSFGNQPLHHLIECGKAHEESLQLVLQKVGKSIDAKNKEGRTPLMIAVSLKNALYVSYLLKYGANVFLSDRSHHSLIHTCALNNDANCAQLLIDYGIDVNSADTTGRTPLHKAAYKGNFEVMKILVESKADVNAVDRKKRQPIHYAVDEGHKQCVDLLLSCKSIQLNISDENKETPLSIAQARGEKDIMKAMERLTKWRFVRFSLITGGIIIGTGLSAFLLYKLLKVKRVTSFVEY